MEVSWGTCQTPSPSGQRSRGCRRSLGWGRLEDRVRYNAILCVLAQYVRWHMMRALEPLMAEGKEYSFELLMGHLETIQRNTMESAGQQFNLTTQPDELHRRIFAHLGLPLP